MYPTYICSEVGIQHILLESSLSSIYSRPTKSESFSNSDENSWAVSALSNSCYKNITKIPPLEQCRVLLYIKWCYPLNSLLMNYLNYLRENA